MWFVAYFSWFACVGLFAFSGPGKVDVGTFVISTGGGGGGDKVYSASEPLASLPFLEWKSRDTKGVDC
jgi:hypothetical protein